jgi:hypothetical protein
MQRLAPYRACIAIGAAIHDTFGSRLDVGVISFGVDDAAK